MKELWNISQQWVHKKSVACLAKWTVSSLPEPNPEDHLCSINISVGKDVPLTQWFSLLLVNESKKSQLEALSFCSPCDGHVYKWVCGRLLVVSCPHVWRWGTWALWAILYAPAGLLWARLIVTSHGTTCAFWMPPKNSAFADFVLSVLCKRLMCEGSCGGTCVQV